MSKLQERLPVQVVLVIIFFGMVHSKCRPKCRLHLEDLGYPTCPGGLVCKEVRGEHRCYDPPIVYNDPGVCLPKLNSGQVDECTLGPVDGCDSSTTAFKGMPSTTVEVVNTDVCTFSEQAYDLDACEETCNSMDCLYYSLVYQTCKIFSKTCAIRAVLGSSANSIRYRVCTTSVP